MFFCGNSYRFIVSAFVWRSSWLLRFGVINNFLRGLGELIGRGRICDLLANLLLELAQFINAFVQVASLKSLAGLAQFLDQIAPVFLWQIRRLHHPDQCFEALSK